MRLGAITVIVCVVAGGAMAGELPRAVTPDDFPVPGATSVLLGRDLFFDPVLSGNRTIACASCHDPANGSADSRILPLREDARTPRSEPRHIARHTPALFNLGAREFTVLMQDGGVHADPQTRFGFALPDGLFLERPVTSALAAQALLPMVSPEKMAGQPGGNPIADAAAAGRITGLGGAWDLIARRVEAIPDYRRRFDWLIGADEPLHATHIAQTLADFITYEFRATDSAFDAFLRGNDTALDNDQLRGMALFYGKAGCATCHAGPFQTDHRFHAMALPQIGPGKGHGQTGLADHGRGAITGLPGDLYRFRTPSLRNIALTAPYGHSGAISTLEAMIRHHLDPLTALAEYRHFDRDISEGAMGDFDEVLAIGAAARSTATRLSERDIAALLRFLDALTDTGFATDRLGAPARVPSGLPVAGHPPHS